MNTFNADILLHSPFSNSKENQPVRPFSPRTEVSFSKCSAYQDCSTYNEESFLSYVVLLDKIITNGMSCTPVLKKSIMDSILNLQTLLSRQLNESWNISASLISLAEQLFFKACAEYLVYLKSGPTVYSHVLHSLSYQCGKTFKEDVNDLKAFSASMSLVSTMSLALVEFSNIQLVWKSTDLSDKIVQELIPEDGAIRRLRTTLLTSALTKFPSFNPGISVRDICTLSEQISPYLFEKDIYRILSLMQSFPPTSEESAIPFTPLIVTKVIFKNLPRPDNFDLQKIDSHSLTSMDAELFLVWTMLWCRLEVPRSSRLLYQSLPITAEQVKMWQALVSYLEGKQKNPSVLLKLQKIMETVRLRSKSFSLKLSFAAFRWMRRAEYPSYWTDLYAQQIGDAIANCVLPSRSSDNVFVVTTPDALIDVEEEARILAILLKYNVSRLIASERYLEAEQLLQTSKSSESKKDLSKLYDHWLKFASGNEKLLIRKKIDELDNDLTALGLRTPKISLDDSVVSSHDGFLNDTLAIFGEDGKSPEENIMRDIFKRNIRILTPRSGVSRTIPFSNSPTVFSSPMADSSKGNDSMQSLDDTSFHSLQSEATTIANHSFASALESPYKEGNSLILNDSSPKQDPVPFCLSPTDTKECDNAVKSSDADMSQLNATAQSTIANEEEEFNSYCYELMMQKIANTRRMLDDLSKRSPI